MIEGITLSEVAFIIVLYKICLNDSNTFKSLNRIMLRNGEKINLIIYDNSPYNQDFYNSNKVTVISYFNDKNNPGVSKAYNYGADIARNKGFKWIVLLDQDTTFSTDFVSKALDAINYNTQIKLFAPILKLKDGTPFSPSRYIFKRGQPVKLRQGVLSLEKYAPVNSGMIINIDAFIKVGGYVEQVKLDFADFQFIERFRKVYKSFYLFNSTAIQDFSNNETDISKLETRFAIYCNCGKNCIRYSLIDNLMYLYPILRHTIGLYIKTKSLSFFKIAYLSYFK